MAQEHITIGTADAGAGDTPYAAWTKAENNFNEIYLSLETTNKVLVTGAATLDSTAFGKVHLLSGTSADYTVALPTAVGNEGKMICFKGDPLVANLNKAVTIDGASTELIDNYSSLALSTGGFMTLIARVTAGVGSWDVISFNQGASIAYTPTVTGFATTPTTTGTNYKLQGKVLFVVLHVLYSSATSNSTAFTITIPSQFTAQMSQEFILTRVINNNAFITTGSGLATISGSSSVLTLYTSIAAALWTASSNKGIQSIMLAINVN